MPVALTLVPTAAYLGDWCASDHDCKMLTSGEGVCRGNSCTCPDGRFPQDRETCGEMPPQWVKTIPVFLTVNRHLYALRGSPWPIPNLLPYSPGRSTKGFVSVSDQSQLSSCLSCGIGLCVTALKTPRYPRAAGAVGGQQPGIQTRLWLVNMQRSP